MFQKNTKLHTYTREIVFFLSFDGDINRGTRRYDLRPLFAMLSITLSNSTFQTKLLRILSPAHMTTNSDTDDFLNYSKI